MWDVVTATMCRHAELLAGHHGPPRKFGFADLIQALADDSRLTLHCYTDLLVQNSNQPPLSMLSKLIPRHSREYHQDMAVEKPRFLLVVTKFEEGGKGIVKDQGKDDANHVASTKFDVHCKENEGGLESKENQLGEWNGDRPQRLVERPRLLLRGDSLLDVLLSLEPDGE